mmetsp:Transcript_105893/g.341575  ORF Transcript_105893/g.341575 Transcript_105893/m.341575 type:complete len:228 (-) Transcript_105893:629-1312(-)
MHIRMHARSMHACTSACVCVCILLPSTATRSRHQLAEVLPLNQNLLHHAFRRDSSGDAAFPPVFVSPERAQHSCHAVEVPPPVQAMNLDDIAFFEHPGWQWGRHRAVRRGSTGRVAGSSVTGCCRHRRRGGSGEGGDSGGCWLLEDHGVEASAVHPVLPLLVKVNRQADPACEACHDVPAPEAATLARVEHEQTAALGQQLRGTYHHHAPHLRGLEPLLVHEHGACH